MNDREIHNHFENDCQNVPTYDFVGAHGSINDYGDVDRLIEDFINSIEDGYFLQWEAVERTEHGLPLTPLQQKTMDDLVSFCEDPNQPILYIDEIARPMEPWYVIIQRIAEWLLLDQLRTSDVHFACATEGWPNLYECVEAPENKLIPPEGIASPINVVPIELQHRLWLQSCFDPLLGIGQPTYEKDPEVIRLKDQTFRVDEFIEELREHRDTVEYLNLTLENMLKILVMPKNDEKLFVMLMSENLGLESRQTLLSGFL
ncbi:hypothetical protein DSCO28_66860 [Desulfosarcina ovata subsp. sediminis]|uniref:Uncharacterized protein n=1 Tax=Desulfosarcina ovata subsp. sediminis TaxID=885957 RepID=A0A5K8A1C4_9BACT|nr:hypothetical protein [Desulfosarcina ovata]BBO86120.1 hypothetical protein DSCO28_66860 [Desulfosarcina ovata subsp. sediminis]